MAARSILEIDVKDEKFQEFLAAFENYRAHVKAMPGDWKGIGTAAAKAQSDINKSFGVQATQAGKVSTELNKQVQSQSELTRHAKNSNIAFKDLARTTGTILNNVANTTFQLLKWGALGGIAGLAAGAGFGGMANAAADARKQSALLGVTPGQLSAGRIYFSRWFDSDQVFGNLAAMQRDPTMAGFLSGFGISGDKLKGNPANNLADILPKLINLWQTQGKLGYEAHKADQIIDEQTMAMLAKQNPKDVQDQIAQFRSDSEYLNYGDKTLNAWQKLKEQAGRSVSHIGKETTEALTPLTGPLSRLSSAVDTAVGEFLRLPSVSASIRDFGDALTDVARYLKSDQFRQDMAHPEAAAARAATSIFGSTPSWLVNPLYAWAHPGSTISDYGSQLGQDLAGGRQNIKDFLNWNPMDSVSDMLQWSTKFGHPLPGIVDSISQQREDSRKRKIAAMIKSGTMHPISTDYTGSSYPTNYVMRQQAPNQHPVVDLNINVNRTPGSDVIDITNQAARGP